MITARPMLVMAAITLLTVTACNGGSVNDGVVSDAYGNQATLGRNPAPEPEPTQKPAKTPPTWGQRYTWDDGVAVEVSPPQPCKPGKYAAPEGIQRAVKFTVKIVNGSKEAVSAALYSGGSAQFAGQKSEMVFDTGGSCGGGGLESATILPGKAYTYSIAYAVGAQPGEMQMSFQGHFGGDEAVYVGQA